ncbi:MAG: type transport system ATP-binding protein [Tepidanaerobacteraceae bacterium]|nr:type transport system ATP-binding protein [Tepidanaerobacteraceae bacterium]
MNIYCEVSIDCHVFFLDEVYSLDRKLIKRKKTYYRRIYKEADGLIVIQNLTKKYGNVLAVNNLSLNISKGEFFGLLGPNGAGKTSVVKILCTLTSSTSGEVFVDGIHISRDNSLVKRKLGVVPQYINLEWEMTVWENLELHGRLYKIPVQKRKRKIEELLDFFELASKSKEEVRKLSGGMQKKLMIARALMHDPQVLILDEPTASLDPDIRRKIWDLAKTLHQKNLTVVLTTHYIEEAEMLCERVGLMNEGVLVELGNPKDLIKKAGSFVLEYFVDGKTVREFFATREQAFKRAEALHSSSVNIRETNLEDVFLKLTNRRME